MNLSCRGPECLKGPCVIERQAWRSLASGRSWNGREVLLEAGGLGGPGDSGGAGRSWEVLGTLFGRGLKNFEQLIRSEKPSQQLPSCNHQV